MSNVKYSEFQAILDKACEDRNFILPNITKVEDPAKALLMISSCTKIGPAPYSMRLGPKNLVYYPKIFLETGGMGSRFIGSGVILAGGIAYRFHMCDHDWDTSGANPNRGWHPKRCKECGVDISIDSGD